jgi:hypothetical protein
MKDESHGSRQGYDPMLTTTIVFLLGGASGLLTSGLYIAVRQFDSELDHSSRQDDFFVPLFCGVATLLIAAAMVVGSYL